MKKWLMRLATTPIGFVISSMVLVALVIGLAKALLYAGRDVKIVGTVPEIQQKYQQYQEKKQQENKPSTPTPQEKVY